MDLKAEITALRTRLDQLDTREKACVLHGLLGWFEATADRGDMAEPHEIHAARAFIVAASVSAEHAPQSLNSTEH